MDIQMPGMDGITATEHIRALPHPARNLPILAMTANVLPQQVAQFRSAGMNDHIGKPFKRDELYAAVKRWAGVRQNATTGTKTEPVA
jgi:CheY-like chemotaxis protein